MIHLRLLGAAELSNAHGDEARSVLAQPKRFALLAYLVVESDRGPRTRGSLLPLFWPDADQARARGALNNTVYRLRRSLGSGAVVSREGDELAIGSGELWCDVTAFRAALAEGDAETALELYRGDLLDGFALAGAAGFDRWLEAARLRLRQRARSACRALVDASEAEGDLERAIGWAHRSLELVPEDERAVRRLIELSGRAGDRAGALEAYELFRRRFEEAFGERPSAATRAAVDALRHSGRGDDPAAHIHGTRGPPARASGEGAGDGVGARAGGGAGDDDTEGPEPPARVAGGSEPDRGRGSDPAAPADRGARSVPAGRAGGDDRRRRSSGRAARSRRRRRVGIAAAVTLVAVLLLAAGAVLIRRSGPPRPTPAAGSGGVALLPFAVYGTGAFDYLAEGMPLLLGAGLDGIEGYGAVNPRTVLRHVAGIRAGELTPARAADVARRFRAEFFVLGAVFENDGRLRLTASLYDRAAPERVLADAVVEGRDTRLFALADELTLRLLRQVDGRDPRSADGSIPATNSLAALKAYLEGEGEAREGRYGTAMAAYRRAIAADTGFALAHYGLSVAANWSADYALARRAADWAGRYEDRLSARGRLAVRAWRAYLSGATEVAEPLYRALVEEDPASPEAWFYLGEIGFHRLPAAGRPLTGSRRAWERVLALEPDHAGALIHLARIAAREGHGPELDSIVTHLLALEPSPREALELRALRAFVTGTRTDRERVAAEVASADDGAAHTAVWSVANYSGSVDGAAALAGSLTRTDRAPAERTVAHLLRARLLIAGGRLDAARAELEAVAALAPAWAVEYRAMIASLPFLPVSDAEIEAALAAVDRLRYTPDTAPVDALLPWAGSGPARRLFLLGRLNLRLGHAGAAEARATDLERFRGAGPADTVRARDYARTLRADIARRRGAPHEALAIVGEPDAPPGATARGALGYPTAHEWWLRAELLRELGRDDDALQRYALFAADYALMYRTAGHLQRARIHERRGAPERSARHYGRALRDWRDADPLMAPLVDAAREGRARTAQR